MTEGPPGRGPALRIAIVTSGRFHVLDLARELVALGHDVTFYSLLPPSRLEARGLEGRRGVWLGAAAGAPFLLQRRLRSARLRAMTRALTAGLIDRMAALRLGPCDVLLAMSGMSHETLRKARRRFGAVTIVERSSQHIEAQMAALGLPPERASVRRERREYAEADYISVPALHCQKTFLSRGFSPERVLVNPFGVSLEEFPEVPLPASSPPRMIMVGTWSRQKGADLLIEALRRVRRVLPDAELLHVGARGDLPLPTQEPGFTHQDPVPQASLSAFYARAHVGVLASRQEGLAVVQAQVLASGLPLVCTDRTGGADLGALLEGGPPVSVVPAEDPARLADALIAALTPGSGPGWRRHPLGPEDRARLAWSGYAKRWDETLRALVKKPR